MNDEREWLNIEALIALRGRQTRARAWKQIRWMALWLVLMLTVFILEFIFLPIPGHAGMPNSCPVPGHGGPPCNMEKCRAMDKDGKKTGVNCSKYCAKSCCLCSDACPKEQNQNSPNDEEYIAYQFGD